MNQLLRTLALTLCLLPLQLLAEEQQQTTNTKASNNSSSDNVVKILGVSERLHKKGRLVDVIEKTELIDHQALQQKQAMNLSDAISNEPGIRVNNECSMCGMKRVMINGLKGEHTTILVDGVPMHSVVSSYYGVDAITSAGIEQIEVARGSGASLIAPEAMGGTINIITKKARANSLSANFGIHDDGDRQMNIVGTAVSEDRKTGLSLAAQFTEIDQYDGDNNGISESPGMTNQSIMVKIKHDINENNSFEFKTSLFDSEVFGGPMNTSYTEVLLSEQNGATAPGAFFVNGDVRELFLANPWETTETIQTERQELMARWIHEVDFNNHFELTASQISNEQDSYYESFDYANSDDINFLDFKWSNVYSDEVMFTFGSDYKSENMRSHSKKLQLLQQQNALLTGDSFDYQVNGFYLQQNWFQSVNTEWNFALRYDQIKTNWIEQSAQKYELNEKLITPRMHMRSDHNDYWTSRFSLGQGYRAPLTFFESDHGILESGFQIGIDQLEKSTSANYALTYEGGKLSVTSSVALSRIKNLAYIEVENDTRPTLVNSSLIFDLATFDIVYGYSMSDIWNISGSFEWYKMEKEYKATFGVVPIEQRIKLTNELTLDSWSAYVDITWIGSRNLAEYGYTNRYNIFNDANQNNLVDTGELQDLKSTKAEAYFIVNAKINHTLSKNFKFYYGVKNLLNYSQVKDMDSPLFWEENNGTASYDVAHIYGPLRGREIYLGLSLDF